MSKETNSPLVAAALAFDEELQRFARASETARRRSLVSKKDLEQAAESLKVAADAEQLLGARAQALLQALTAARDEQQSQSQAAQARATEVQERYGIYASLIERVKQIGEEAVSLTDVARQLTAKKRDDAPLATDTELVTGLIEIERRLASVSDKAKLLAEEARGSDFEEIARDAHGLQQTLAATRNKISLLQRAIGARAEASDA